MSAQASRLVVAANRLPVRWNEQEERWTASPGGLVSALAPILRERGGVWVGWTGATGGEPESFDADGIDQEFFEGTSWKSLVVVNIGHPAENAWFDRLPRLEQDEAVLSL